MCFSSTPPIPQIPARQTAVSPDGGDVTSRMFDQRQRRLASAASILTGPAGTPAASTTAGPVGTSKVLGA